MLAYLGVNGFVSSLVDYEVPKKDVVFLLDGSDGTRNGFPAILDFVQGVVEKFNLEDSMDRVSVVQYSTNAEVDFYLNTYATKDEILNAISAVKHKGGRRVNTGSALQYVRENVFTASAGSRHQQGVPNILILLRGSRSTDNVDQAASALKESGVLIFGVGTRNLSSEIQRIANGPSYAQTVSEFSDLANVQQQFYTSLSSALLDETPAIPTVIGKVYFNSNDQFVCLNRFGIPPCHGLFENLHIMNNISLQKLFQRFRPFQSILRSRQLCLRNFLAHIG